MDTSVGLYLIWLEMINLAHAIGMRRTPVSLCHRGPAVRVKEQHLDLEPLILLRGRGNEASEALYSVTLCTLNAFLFCMMCHEEIAEPGARGGDSVPGEPTGQHCGVRVRLPPSSKLSRFVARCFLCPGSWVRSALSQQMWSLSLLLIQIHNWTINGTMGNSQCQGSSFIADFR